MAMFSTPSANMILVSSSSSNNNKGTIRLKNIIFIKLKTKNKATSSRKSSSLKAAAAASASGGGGVFESSRRVLEWDKVCDGVASFAGTSLGTQQTKAQLLESSSSFQESVRLLTETDAAVAMHTHHSSLIMDFTSLRITLVQSCIQNAHRGFPLLGSEAVALASIISLADSLQTNLISAIKQDSDCLSRFMPVSQMIMDISVNRPLVKFIHKLVDQDGSVKDSASPSLKRFREQVRLLERKLYRLMESLISSEMTQTSSLELSNVDGRWCIKSGTDLKRGFDGLLLSSGSGTGSIVEPLSAVPLNDELQQARASVAKAEADVLLEITHKMQTDLDDIENLFSAIIQLDVINARATYSISFGGTSPELFSFEDPVASQPTHEKWKLYLPRAYHPLLLQQHRKNMYKAMKDVSDATAVIRRRRQQAGIASQKEEGTYTRLSYLEAKVAKLKQSSPVPVDIFVAQKTRVLVVTGPNTGGKTIFLKTVGLAALMAKSGLYVLSSEPVKMPWFDSVFADIGDEQSLSQSLSTFSGHLKQTSDIRAHSTSQSLVLLDEVGAGTNPLEGAALGMSLLECFAEAGALLTMATTHHGELKTLKYSNDAFENACMEFDEVNLKPTYRILWGIPGRSNAISIAERLGLPNVVVENARELHGTASAEINEVIEDMEKLKQKLHEDIHEARRHLKLARELNRNLMVSEHKIRDHITTKRYRKIQEISDAGGVARSILNKKVRQHRVSPNLASKVDSMVASSSSQSTHKEDTIMLSTSDVEQQPQGEKKSKVVKAGDVVHVSKFNKKASVLKVDPSKGEILVQIGNMKLKLRVADVVI
uniref:endonuclease MutS2 isoform X2 n=1 Tax=Erigeron canadensis TaxID=72917 RepID=UPI001CB9B589|nr:endonuclease MutS2 isoform X2 [Erigeron canadensis]